MRFLALFLLVAAAPLGSAGQPAVSIGSYAFSDGVHPTFTFPFEGTDARFVEAWWKDELKGISQAVSNKKEVVAAGALLPQVSPDTVRVLVKAEQRKGVPMLTAHVAVLTREGWMAPSSDPRAFEAAKAFVQERSTLLRRQLAQQELTQAEKGLARLISELNGLQREKERAEAGIERSRQRAAEAVREQERLAAEAEEVSRKAEAQRKENAQGPDAEGERLLADLLKQQARAAEKRKRAGEDELSARKRAEELAQEVRKNLQDQERKRVEVQRQEELVQQLRAKLDAIR